MNKVKSMLCLMILAVTACSPGLYDTVLTNTVPPTVSTPRVTSFSKEYEILVEWDRDIGAEKYVLYRDIKPDGSFNTKIYEGTGLSFVDDEIIDDNYYYYKLAKIRGLQEFEKSDCRMGLSGRIKEDEYEPNNLSENAGELVETIVANIFYYCDPDGNEVIDNDWYKVTIGPKQKMRIDFNSLYNCYDSDQSIGEGELQFNLMGKELQDIYNNSNFWIDNDTSQSRDYYFQVSINKALVGSITISYRMFIFQVSYIQ